MFDQVAVSEAGCGFIVPPYVSAVWEHETASPVPPTQTGAAAARGCRVARIRVGKTSRHRSAGGRGGFGLRVLFVVAAVAFAGLVALPRGSVAADQLSFPAAQGQISSPAAVVADPTATDGQVLQNDAATPE